LEFLITFAYKFTYYTLTVPVLSLPGERGPIGRVPQVRQKPKTFFQKTNVKRPEKSRKTFHGFWLLIKSIKNLKSANKRKKLFSDKFEYKSGKKTFLWQICPNSVNKTFLWLFGVRFLRESFWSGFFCLTSRNSINNRFAGPCWTERRHCFGTRSCSSGNARMFCII
jgi:hypothetical protein